MPTTGWWRPGLRGAACRCDPRLGLECPRSQTTRRGGGGRCPPKVLDEGSFLVQVVEPTLKLDPLDDSSEDTSTPPVPPPHTHPSRAPARPHVAGLASPAATESTRGRGGLVHHATQAEYRRWLGLIYGYTKALCDNLTLLARPRLRLSSAPQQNNAPSHRTAPRRATPANTSAVARARGRGMGGAGGIAAAVTPMRGDAGTLPSCSWITPLTVISLCAPCLPQIESSDRSNSHALSCGSGYLQHPLGMVPDARYMKEKGRGRMRSHTLTIIYVSQTKQLHVLDETKPNSTSTLRDKFTILVREPQMGHA